MTYSIITESKDENEQRDYDREISTPPGEVVRRVTRGSRDLMKLMQGGQS